MKRQKNSKNARKFKNKKNNKKKNKKNLKCGWMNQKKGCFVLFKYVTCNFQ